MPFGDQYGLAPCGITSVSPEPSALTTQIPWLVALDFSWQSNARRDPSGDPTRRWMWPLLHWLPASHRDTRAMRSRPHLRPRPAPRSAFAGYRFPPEVIALAVRWYLRFGLSYRDVEELLAERGIEVDHVTVYRWVQRFAPEFAEAA